MQANPFVQESKGRKSGDLFKRRDRNWLAQARQHRPLKTPIDTVSIRAITSWDVRALPEFATSLSDTDVRFFIQTLAWPVTEQAMAM